MKTRFLIILTSVIVGLATAYAGDSTFTLQPKLFVFDPDRTGIASAMWVNLQGLADNDQDLAAGKAGKALVLKKLGPTSTNASAGASIFGSTWIQFRSNELGFDIRNDSYHSVGSPRFNVATADGGFYFCGADGAASQTTFTDAQSRSWTRFRFSGADCYPNDQLQPNAIITAIDLIADEETNSVGSVIDNISVNGTLIRKD
jgi:hypothetical protein